MGHDDTDRRSLLAWAVTGLGAIFTAVLGAPVALYLIDPCNRKGGGSDFRAVDMIPHFTATAEDTRGRCQTTPPPSDPAGST